MQHLEDAGAIVLSKTNMPELAAALNGYNPNFGHCWNPHALGFSPGGSSNGTAAAIAAGMAPAGIGSDTAGSLRIPADYCGVVGLRPSPCRYTQTGCVPLSRQDTMGPMGLTVADVALIDAVMAGGADAAAAADLKGLKVCAPKAWVGELSAGHTEAMELATAALTAAGATVVDDPAFAAVDEAMNNFKTLHFGKGPATSRRTLKQYLESHAGLKDSVTPDDVANGFHWTNPMIPMGLMSEEAKSVAEMGDEDFKGATAEFIKEKAEAEAVLQAGPTECPPSPGPNVTTL